MARQDVVRALVLRSEVDRLRTELTDDLGVPDHQIEVTEPAPDTYRDEQPDRELRSLVRAGRARVAIGAVVGAVVGALVALAVSPLRDLMPFSLVLLAFGGAWGTGAAVAARTVQVHRDEGARPEKLHEVDEGDTHTFRLMTIRVQRDRDAVADHLADRGVTLLDSQHPRVGQDETGARPAEDGDGTTGPAEP